MKKNIGQVVSDSMIDGIGIHHTYYHCCLLYTSDAADE